MQKNILIPFLLLVSACAKPALTGTETGNALQESPAKTSLTTVGYALTEQMCWALNACVPSSNVDECITQVSQQAGLAQLFGVSDSSITTMSQLEVAELDGLEVASTVTASACIEQLASIPCTASAWSTTYSAITQSYAGISSVIPQASACGKVYSGK